VDEKAHKNPFHYKKLESLTTKKDSLESEDARYLCALLATNTNFVSVVGMFKVKRKLTVEGNIFKKYGLKFHVSLPEKDAEKYNFGWDIITNILMKQSILAFKIVKPGVKMSDDPTQRGKEITIYADANPEKSIADWTNILTEITRQLTQNGVSPGYRPPGTDEKKEGYIQGSNYVSYRYYDEKTKESVWPKNDPCEGISMDVKNQLPIPEWKSEENKSNLMEVFTHGKH